MPERQPHLLELRQNFENFLEIFEKFPENLECWNVLKHG